MVEYSRIVVHITDSEANSYIRCRRFMAEPAKLMAYDEKAWATSLHYHDQVTEVLWNYSVAPAQHLQLIRSLLRRFGQTPSISRKWHDDAG